MSKFKAFFSSVKVKRTLSFSAVVLWMAVIFVLSSQNSADSGRLSDKFEKVVIDVTVENADEMPLGDFNVIRVKVEDFVRSSAHFLCFTVLGALSVIALLTYKIKLWQKATCSAVFGWAYSLTDEIHQYFVPGRTFQWSDIGIDMLGVAIGVALTAGVIFCVLKKKGKKNVENT